MSFKKCVVLEFTKSSSQPSYLIYSRLAKAMEYNVWIHDDYLKIYFVQTDDKRVFLSELMEDKVCNRMKSYMHTFQRYILTYHENMFLLHDTFHQEKDTTIMIDDVQEVARRLGIK